MSNVQQIQLSSLDHKIYCELLLGDFWYVRVILVEVVKLLLGEDFDEATSIVSLVHDDDHSKILIIISNVYKFLAHD